jgi:hypothetical protein
MEEILVEAFISTIGRCDPFGLLVLTDARFVRASQCVIPALGNLSSLRADHVLRFQRALYDREIKALQRLGGERTS